MTWYMLDDDKNVIPAPMDPDKNIPTLEYFEWMETRGNKIIKQETVNGHWISTVFLGLDHGHMGKEPMVFETMIFPNQSNLSERDCWRYTNYADAVHGHEDACKVAAQYGSGIDKADLERAAKVIQDFLKD